MPTNQIRILPEDVFSRIFGLVAIPRFISYAAQALVPNTGLRLLGTDGAKATSAMNTPVYDTLTLKFNEDDGGYVMPYTVVINVRKRKRIVETIINNKDGEILEFINKSNATISIKGAIPALGMPYINIDEARSMEEYLEHVGTLIVESQYLNDLGIKSAVVMDWEFMPVAGGNWLPFTIEMRANNPEEYRVLSENFILAEVG